jgi:2-polyprenyl-3-methyl-5-hydroxy-6-metoxy-1,4-benzoquinol methylase
MPFNPLIFKRALNLKGNFIMAFDKETIRLAYKLFLGRDPESEDVVREKASRLNSFEDVREEFLNSTEFVMCLRDGLIRENLNSECPTGRANFIQVIASMEEMDALFLRVKEQWTALGNTEPYWSVLSANEYKSDVIHESRDEFYSSGKSILDFLTHVAHRNEVIIPRGSCFELGCGVGRITAHIASNFSHVIAADISSGNLDLCRNYLSSMRISNVRTVLFETPSDINIITPFDVFISFIVLQHNPPPVQYYLLDKIFSQLKPGGLALFQLPTYHFNYSYAIKDHLNSLKPIMDMHCLPMRCVMELFRKHDFSVLEILKDSWAGAGFHSHTFFAIKRADA